MSIDVTCLVWLTSSVEVCPPSGLTWYINWPEKKLIKKKIQFINTTNYLWDSRLFYFPPLSPSSACSLWSLIFPTGICAIISVEVMRQSVKRMIESEDTIWIEYYYSWSFACACTAFVFLFFSGIALLILSMPQMPKNPWETCMDAEPEQIEWIQSMLKRHCFNCLIQLLHGNTGLNKHHWDTRVLLLYCVTGA